METIVNYFEHIPSLHRSLILITGIAFFWLLESAAPLFRFQYYKWNHAGINLFFTLTTVLVNFTMAFLLLKTSDWVVANGIGILQWVPDLSLWMQMIIGLLLLDLIGAWFIHWLEHQVRWLWKFHLIHHTDPYVDTTTANRHHPGESVFRFVFTLIAVIVAGAPMWLVFLYQSLSVILSQFNHANIRLPGFVEKTVNKIFVTPGMHHIHHHYQLPLTDTNYGNIFSFWDRFFGTYSSVKEDELVYGVDTHMKPDENSKVGNLLRIPFQKYRPPVTQMKKEMNSNSDA